MAVNELKDGQKEKKLRKKINHTHVAPSSGCGPKQPHRLFMPGAGPGFI